MVSAFFKLVFDATAVFDPKYKHDNGFDVTTECQVNGKSGDRDCCGLYPHRKSFNYGENKACCKEQTLYSPMVSKCCSDGSTTSIGNDCWVIFNMNENSKLICHSFKYFCLSFVFLCCRNKPSRVNFRVGYSGSKRYWNDLWVKQL